MIRTAKMILVSVLILCTVVFMGRRHNSASAGSLCFIEDNYLNAALSNTQGITKIMVTESVPAEKTTWNLNKDGTAVAYMSDTTFCMAPKTAGDKVALKGSCNSMFSPEDKPKLRSLEELDLRGMDTSTVTSFANLLYLDPEGSVTPTLKMVNMSGLNLSALTTMEYIFFGESALTSIDFSDAQFGSLVDTNRAFAFCRSLKNLDLSDMDTSKVTDMSGMFLGVGNDIGQPWLTLSTDSLTTLESFLLKADIPVFTLGNMDTSKVTNMEQMFSGCQSLFTLDLRGMNTDNVTSMWCMFNECRNLQTLDISSFNTAKVTNMGGMFCGCTNLIELNLRKFNTAQVTDMGSMFEDCEKLTAIDCRSFDTTKVKSMDYMFSGCQGLTVLDLRNFSSASLEKAHGMFWLCTNITNINLENFEGKYGFKNRDTDLSAMFKDCWSLQYLNMSHWSPNDGMTFKMQSDGTIPIADDDNKSLIYQMFLNCNNLKGVCLPTRVIKGKLTAAGALSDEVGYHDYDGKRTCTICGLCSQFINTGNHIFQASAGQCVYCGICYSLFSTGAHNLVGGVCSDCGFVSDDCAVMGYDLSLADNIQMNVYIYLTEDVKQDVQGYVTFSKPSGESKKCYIGDAKEKNENVNGKSCYVFECEVYAKEMADSIGVQVYNGSNEGKLPDGVSVSVVNYASSIMNGQYDQKTKDLVQAMLNYGAYAQTFFGYNTETLANKNYELTLPTKARLIDKLDIEKYKPKVACYATHGIVFEGCSLVLEDKIAVRFYFSFDNTATAAEKAKWIKDLWLNEGQNGLYYYEHSERLAVANWDKMVESALGDVSAMYSPLSYISEVLNYKSSGALFDVVRAMYVYWESAQAYLGIIG